MIVSAPPRPVVALFEDMANLPVEEAWAVAADAVESARDEAAEISVGGVVEVLPTSPARSRRPDLLRAGIDPGARLCDLSSERRHAIAEALRLGRRLRVG